MMTVLTDNKQQLSFHFPKLYQEKETTQFRPFSHRQYFVFPLFCVATPLIGLV